jgi:hypothetical protein
MSMRSQIYAWNGANFNPALAPATPPGFVPGTTGTQISIFIGGFGNNITKPAETTATEFVVIEDVSCTPSLPATDLATGVGTVVPGQLNGWTMAATGGVFGPRAYLQVRINTTDYFLNPDNVTNLPSFFGFPTFVQPLS